MVLIELSYALKQLSSPTRYLLTLAIFIAIVLRWQHSYHNLMRKKSVRILHQQHPLPTPPEFGPLIALFAPYAGHHTIEMNDVRPVLTVHGTLPYRALIQKLSAITQRHTLEGCSLQRTTDGYVTCVLQIKGAA